MLTNVWIYNYTYLKYLKCSWQVTPYCVAKSPQHMGLSLNDGNF